MLHKVAMKRSKDVVVVSKVTTLKKSRERTKKKQRQMIKETEKRLHDNQPHLYLIHEHVQILVDRRISHNKSTSKYCSY
ncbi:hypothetical protein Glove_109g90 [Diversispora epigaea]|uniref:Uncharacterized protein n=1 Tax=Diversispora epigaea TaxID=1348612 RepID=A0A397J245_9GLOM|nr:hypothetical protein Glove_109g90 [Diversispora epigaea]